MSRRVLITGATGFVGANLLRRMVELGHEVHAAVRPSSTSWRLPVGDFSSDDVWGVSQFELHEVDLLDASRVREVVEAVRPEVVLHFAAHAALHSEPDEMEIILHTVQPLVNLASACNGCELFVNAGSSSEYGYQTEPMAETSLPDPSRVHDIAKLTQTLYGTYAARFKNLPLVTLRLFSVYGPFEHGRRLIPRLMLSAVKRRPMSLSSPDVSRDFIYVGDVVRAVEHCMAKPPEPGAIFNLGTGVEHTLRDAVQYLQQIHGSELPVTWGNVARQAWDSPRWVADTRLQERELGFRAQTDFRTGLRETYLWFSGNADSFEEYAEN